MRTFEELMDTARRTPPGYMLVTPGEMVMLRKNDGEFLSYGPTGRSGVTFMGHTLVMCRPPDHDEAYAQEMRRG